MIELTKVSELATENVAATVVASTVAAGGLFLVTYNLMGPKIRSDKGTSKRNFFTLSKGLTPPKGGLTTITCVSTMNDACSRRRRAPSRMSAWM